jgi:ribosomal-protein-alanine N-acetyltransferase
MTPYALYRVRPLEARDLPEIISIERMVFKNPWPESVYIHELHFNPNAYYFVLQLPARQKRRLWQSRYAPKVSRIVGFIGLRVEFGNAHISTLAVHPKWQGLGLGEFLLTVGLRQAVTVGVQSVTLEVRVSNHVARNLYTKYGFNAASRLPEYYRDGEDAYLMRLNTLDDDVYQETLDTRHAALQKRLHHELLERDTDIK